MPELFSNGGVLTTLNGGINNSVTSITTHAAPPSELQALGQFHIVIGGSATPVVVGGATVGNLIQGGEILLVTGAPSSTSWTVQRGVEGSTAASHTDGDSIIHVATAATLQNAGTNPIGDAATRGEGVYLVAWFTNAEQKLWLGVSNNGLAWNTIGRAAVYSPASGSLRDPSIFVLDPNEVYSPQPSVRYLACHTNEGSPLGFDVISSPDLQDWSLVHHVDCTSIASLAHVWAPEWFIDTDGSIHVFVACSNSGTTAFQIYETHPTNAALTTWSNPAIVTGTSLPSDMIDPFMVKVGNTYNIWYKNDSTKYIEYLSSTSLTSGYTVTKSGDWASWGSGLEGPSLLQVDSSTWRIYFDKYTAQGIYYSESTDNWATWSAKALITSPITMSHGTVVRVRDLPTQRNMSGQFMGLVTPLTSITSFISSDVNLGNHLTWTSITSVTLGPGVWLVCGMCTFRNETTTSTAFMSRIWDGTTTFASDETMTLAQFQAVSNCKFCVVTLETSTTLTLQASNFAGDGATRKVWSTASDLAVGTNVSGIVAVRLG